MSGGYFDYLQYRIEEAATEVVRWVELRGEGLSEETLTKLNLTRDVLDNVSHMLQRVDWFISCDDSEESFNRRWVEDGLYCEDTLIKPTSLNDK